MRISLLFIIISVLNIFSISGNNAYSISKIEELLLNKTDSEQYFILKKYSWEIRNINSEISYFYGNKALKIADSLNMTDERASINNYIGIFKRNINNYPESLKYFIKALEIAKTTNNLKEIAYAYNNIGDIYRRLKNDSLSISNFNQAVNIFKETGNNKGLAYCYNQLSLFYIEKKDFEKALENNNYSINLRKKQNDETGLAANYRNSGDIYVKKGDFIMAEGYYKKAMIIDEKLENKHGLGYTYNNLGNLYNANHNYKKAIPYLFNALKIGRNIKSFIIINNASMNLSFAYEHLKNYKEAFRFYKIYKQTTDSLNSVENAKNITKIGMQFAFKKLQLQNKKKAESKIRKQKIIRNLTLGVLIVILIFAFLIYRSNNYKKNANIILETKNVEISEQKEELVQMNLQLSKSEKELREANKTKDKFFSIIAHDLRSPFTTIFGFTKLLYKDIKELSPEKTKTYLHNILTVSDNAYKLLQNLLDWSMSQTGTIKYSPIKFDVFYVIKDTIEFFHKSAEQKKISITSKVKKGTMVYADINMINTICRNLISNALKFTQREGKIEITSYTENNMDVLTFRDNGIGISTQNISKLFKIDEKIRTSGTEKEKGTGLGLVLCKEFIEKNGGKIWAESKLEHGSSFFISLPNKGFHS